MSATQAYLHKLFVLFSWAHTWLKERSLYQVFCFFTHCHISVFCFAFTLWSLSCRWTLLSLGNFLGAVSIKITLWRWTQMIWATGHMSKLFLMSLFWAPLLRIPNFYRWDYVEHRSTNKSLWFHGSSCLHFSTYDVYVVYARFMAVWLSCSI